MDGYPSVGSIIAGRYRIEALLGEGGMGAVFRASDSQGSPFALKFPAPEIRSRPGMMSRFANEAVAASRIASEHAVHIFGVEATDDGTPFIVMELLTGTDLDQIIEAQAPVDIPRSVHFALQILRALQVAHAAGVVHRDMKPANCFVVAHNGEADFIKIIDFGITKLLGDDAANLTRTSVTMGTPAYMSPEQARSAKAAEPRSDLYAVGVMLYELLTKKRPYDGDSHNELVVKICTEPPMPIRNLRGDLPGELATAVERALVKIPAGRFESAQAFARALAPFADARSAGVLQRIEGGAPNAAALAAALAPTPLASNPGSPPPAPGNRTAIMEPGAPFAAPPVGREPQRTVVADAPIAFAEPKPAAALPPSAAPAVVPAAPMYSESRPSGSGGGGKGALIAILAVLAIGLIVGGMYFGGVFGGTSAAPAPTPAATDEEGDNEPTKKKKKKSPDEPDEPEPPKPAEPDPTPTSPTATKPAVSKPTTTTTGTGTASAPKPSTSTTTTAPTIILPPGFPFPTGSTTTTAPPPATTTAPPATTTAPPATTTAPPASSPPPLVIPKLKPKIGGS